MSLWKKFLSRSGELALSKLKPAPENEDFSDEDLQALFQRIIECRRTYGNAESEKVEQRMASEVKVLAAEYEIIVGRITGEGGINAILECFESALFTEEEGKLEASQIEGRIIWVEGVRCKGLQRITAEKLAVFGQTWINVVVRRLHQAIKKALTGDKAADRLIQFYANFLLLSRSEESRMALKKAIEQYSQAEINQWIDPFRHVREAISKSAGTLGGTWDDHWV